MSLKIWHVKAQGAKAGETTQAVVIAEDMNGARWVAAENDTGSGARWRHAESVLIGTAVTDEEGLVMSEEECPYDHRYSG